MPVFESDILVIGGGMAGASIAAHLSQHAKVRLLEMEAHLGYHSTGRSAALFSEDYGNDVIRALTRASRQFLFSPPTGFASTPLVQPRPVLVVARADQAAALAAYRAAVAGGFDDVSADEALTYCPILRREALGGALITRGSADIEVHELHQGYLRLLKARGGLVATGAQVTSLERGGGDWTASTRDGAYRAPIVINAAGAWAGRLGAMAGAVDIGLVPLQRTAILVDAPPGAYVCDWPMVLDVEETFYLKPEAGVLLASPCDETMVAPGDVQPDEMDVAVAVDRLETATTLQVRHVRRKWAGLRSFVADRSPVVGFDPRQPGFFWLAALGGYGIQTAPALSQLAARLVLARAAEQREAEFGIDPTALDPARATLRRSLEGCSASLPA